MKQIDFNKLASQLKRARAQYPARITRKQFSTALAGILNAAESDRLFDFYIYHHAIEAVSKTCFVFKVRQEYFSTESLIELFSKNQIQSRKYYYFRDGNKQDLKKLYERRKKVKEPIVEQTVLAPLATPAKSIECTIKALSAFSDEELQAELQRRENILNNKKRLNDILAVAEISLNDLKALIALVD